ncbi:UNKNOWN [Stylonychia lemnae]|uniref:Uncharacterized protein n=1 Tax=Stylonychia lemnae TaxID=5949 RepID=A0A078A240_STYLE|nr:UNKNOWN [Stylonychia lemnae]|eukprot:CDW76205.1 UNKNOWN [Stylonychia lemnae]
MSEFQTKQETTTEEQKDSYIPNDKKINNLLPAEYKWMLEDYVEVDYSKIDSRIKTKNLPLRLEEKGKKIEVLQIIMISHRDMLLVEYYHTKQKKNRSVDLINLSTLTLIQTQSLRKSVDEKSKIFHRIFNDVDYIFYQGDQFVFLMKFDDFIEQAYDKTLIQLDFQQCNRFRGVDFIDEFSIMVTYQYFTYIFKFEADNVVHLSTNQAITLFGIIRILLNLSLSIKLPLRQIKEKISTIIRQDI